MSTLFAFFHHVAAFTLVSALAVEFVLVRQELTLATARRLPIADAVLGASAGFLFVVGLSRVFFFEKGAGLLFSQPRFLNQILCLYRCRTAVDYPDDRILVMAQAGACGATAASGRAEIAFHSQDHSR